MIQNAFTSDVTQQAGRQVVGLKVRTTMTTASVDCPKLWEHEFGPRMSEITTGEASFGACMMVDEHSFDYWAALPYNEGAIVPPGMAVLDIPEGLYARCHINSLDELAAAYQNMYQAWSNNAEYTLKCDAPSYELYPPDFHEVGHLDLYMPLQKQEK